MKNNDDIPTTDTTEIKQLINRLKQGKLDQGDALLIEKLLNILLTIVSLLERKHTSIRRMKELLFGMKEKKQGKDETKNRAEESRSVAEENSQPDSPKEMSSKSTCEGDSSPQEVTRPKRPGHGRKAASDYPGARLVRLNHLEMAPGDPCPESGCEGHLHQLVLLNVKTHLTGQPFIRATKYERPVLRRSDCFKRYVADPPEGVKRFENHNAVDRAHFPFFTNELSEAMFEGPIRFITNLLLSLKMVRVKFIATAAPSLSQHALRRFELSVQASAQ